MKLKEFKNKNIAILGLGREGKSTLRFLLELGVKSFDIFDEEKEKVYEIMRYFIELGISIDFEARKEDECYIGKIKIIYQEKKHIISFHCGDFNISLFEKIDIIIKTPGISPYREKYEKYKEKFTSQTRIFSEVYKGRIIGVTGTKGKSTISSLIYESLKESGFIVKLVGNIGTPVLDEINILKKHTYEYVVYEMSSYMLEDGSPHNYISVLNKIYIDHIDWHNGFTNYKKAKANILKSAEYCLINFDCKDIEEIKNSTKNVVFHYGKKGDYTYQNHTFFKGTKKIIDDENIRLKGEHNFLNITALIGVLDIILKDRKKLKSVLSKVLPNFKGLPHRLEVIGTYEGITFIDDAIGSTPESTIEAIKSYGADIGTILLGGTDRGYDFSELVNIIKEAQIPNLVLFPDSGYTLMKEFDGITDENLAQKIHIGETYTATVMKTKSMKKAVAFAYEHTQKKKIALLSCGAPSYSLWENYEEKGNKFQAEVKKKGKS